MNDQAGKLLIQLGNAVTWFRNQEMKSMDLTSSQSGIIQCIQKYPDNKTTAANLMKQLYLSKPTVSKMIHQLEKKELIKRSVDKTDSRKKVIALTQKGLDLKTALKNMERKTEGILLRGMTEKEKIQFVLLMQMALENIFAYREGKEFLVREREEKS